MSRRIPRGRTVAAAALLAAATALAGCGGGGDPQSGPGPTSPAGATTTPTKSESGTPSGGSTYAADPATGPLLEQEHVTVNAPTGWRRAADKLVTFEDGADDPGSDSVLDLGELPMAPKPLDKMAAHEIATGGFAKKPQYVGNVDLNGVPAYHVAGMTDAYTFYDSYGGVYENAMFSITFGLDAETWPPAKRQALIDSVLATVTWK